MKVLMQNPKWQGILWMVASGLFFLAVNGIVRALGTDIPAAQSAFIRYVFGVLFFLPWIGSVLRQRLARDVVQIMAVRGVVHTAAVLFWFYAMARIPVAHVTAIGYLSPVLLMIAGAVVLREPFAKKRALAVLLAMLGMLTVLRPGLQPLALGHLSQVLAAFCFAGSYLCAKQLSGRLSSELIVAYLTFTVTLGLFPIAVLNWAPVGAWHVICLGIVGGFASLGHYAMTRAFAVAPLTVTQPVTFLQIVWASLMGALAFGEAIDPFVILGAGMILGPVIWLTWTDQREQRSL